MRAATMLDILAVLDAAIDVLAPAATSRSTRGQAGPGCAAGTAKTLKSWGVPVVPVVPVPKEGFREAADHSSTASRVKKIESGPATSILFSTGTTGTTGTRGTREDFCESHRTRDGETARELTGT